MVQNTIPRGDHGPTLCRWGGLVQPPPTDGPEYHTQGRSDPPSVGGGWTSSTPLQDGPEYLPRGDHDPPCVGGGLVQPPPTDGQNHTLGMVFWPSVGGGWTSSTPLHKVGHDLPWVWYSGPSVGGGWTSSPSPYTRWVMISPGYGILTISRGGTSSTPTYTRWSWIPYPGEIMTHLV